MYLRFARACFIAATVLSCNAVAPDVRGEDVFDISSHQYSNAIKNSSLGGMSVSQDGRFLLTLIGSKGFTWYMDSKKAMDQVDLEIYDRRFVGKHGFIGTLDLERESKKDVESDEYHIDLIPAGSSKSTRIASHVDAGHIENCVLSPTGKQLAYHSRKWSDGFETITVIEVASGTILCRFAAPDYLQAIAWSNDEKALIFGNGAELQVFDLEGGSQDGIAAPRQTSALQTNEISDICVTESNEVLVGHDDEYLRVYSFGDHTLKLRSTINVGTGSDIVRYHSKSQVAAVFSSNGNVSLIDIGTENVLLRGKSVNFYMPVTSSENLEYVALLGGIFRSVLLDCCLSPLSPIAKSPLNPDPEDSYYGELQFGNTPQNLMRASSEGFSRWQVDAGLVQVVSNHPIEALGIEGPEFMHLAGDLGYLVGSANSLYVSRWDDVSKSVKNQLLLKFPADPRSWDNNAQPLLMFNDNKNDRYRLAVLDTSGKLKGIVDPAGDWDNATMLPDASLIAVSDGRSISLLSGTGKVRFQKDCEVESDDPPLFSSDHQRLIFGPSQIDVGSGDVELVYPFADVSATAVSPSDALTAYGHENGGVFLFSQVSKRLVASLGRMDGSVQSICFHREGRYVAALDEFGAIYLWDTVELSRDVSAEPLQRQPALVPLPLSIKSGAMLITIEGSDSASREQISDALRSALRQVESQ